MVADRSRPLVVCDAAGRPVDVVLENEKGFKKSLESGTLWSLHPETDRLLPYGESDGVSARIEDCGTWYRATLAGDHPSPSDPTAQPAGDTASPGGETRPTREAEAPGGRTPPAGGTRPAGEAVTPGGRTPQDGDTKPPGDTATPGAANSPLSADQNQIGSVLVSLASLIHERRREMPEGSYTTHLFAAGKEKIRKKTGEEAVELILATSTTEVTSEAADLIYHLLVLLEVEGVSLSAIAAELQKR